MFHITAILEDTQVVVTSENGTEFNGFVADGHTGKSAPVAFTANELSAIFALALHHDGMPPGVYEHYEIAEPAMELNGISDGPLRLIP